MPFNFKFYAPSHKKANCMVFDLEINIFVE